MEVQKARDARLKGVSAFMKYCLERNKYHNHLYCFFEGDDAKYYRPRIEQYTKYDFNEINVYNCGGKREVLRAYKLVQENLQSISSTSFFIDSDFEHRDRRVDNLYCTPCYSIENLYTSSTAFARIIVSEFGINPGEDDFSRCLKDYLERQNEFHKHTLLLNTWLACQKLNDGAGMTTINIADFKIGKLFSEISIDCVIIKKDINLGYLKECFPNADEIDQFVFEEKLKEFLDNEQRMIFRGKFELDFMIKVIDSMKYKSKNLTYFSRKHEGVNIDPNINTLSSLSKYADTPNCLIEFLKSFSVPAA